MAAFEALGSFIATFADPKMTGLYLTADGAITVCPANGLSPGRCVAVLKYDLFTLVLKYSSVVLVKQEGNVYIWVYQCVLSSGFLNNLSVIGA